MKVNCRYREHGDGDVSLDQKDVVSILTRMADEHPESKDLLLELAQGFSSVRRLVPLTEMLRDAGYDV